MAQELLVARPQFGRRAGIQDAGGGFGQQAIAEGVSNLATVGAKITDAEYHARASLALARSSQALEESAAAIDADPDIHPSEYEARYGEELARIKAEYGESLPQAYRRAYEERLGLYADNTRLGLLQAGHKRQIQNANADIHEALRLLADKESRAETPAEKAAARKDATDLLGFAQARRLFTPEETYKATDAYRESVWLTALDRSLASQDPLELARTRLRIEVGEGPYGQDEMTEVDRSKALLAVQRREEAVRRDAEIQQRLAEVEGRRVRTEQARAAVSLLLNKAVSKDPAERITPEDYALAAPLLEQYPSLARQLGEMVMKGGRFPPGPPDAGYYARLKDLQANDPAAFAALPPGKNEGPGVTHLDPELLGTAFKDAFDLQTRMKAEGPAAVGSQDKEVDLRWQRIAAKLGDVPIFRTDLHDDFTWDELDAAQLDFYTRIHQAQADYLKINGKNATGLDFTKLVDGVVLDLAQQYADPRLRELVAVRPGVNAGSLLDGISAENLQRVRASLRRSGYEATPEEIRRKYDAGVAAGIIEP